MNLGSSTPENRPVDPARSRRRRTIAVAAGALTLLVAGTPFLPDASGPVPGLSPRASEAPALRSSATAGPGAVTPQMRAEIERVVAEGERTPVSARSSAYRLATAMTRCATFEGQRYCLGIGWTTSSQEEVTSRLAEAAAPTPTRTDTEETGDLSLLAALRRYSKLSPRERATAERAELAAAASAVAKVWLIRHDIQGVPLPASFLEQHPEAAVAARTTTRKHPRKFKILSELQVRPQNRSYYCGPTTVQMIAWGWRDRRQGQALWADRLHTTTAGTGITDMVRVVNHNSGYDREDHAGPYIVLDISDFTYKQWWRLIKKHIHTYKAPVVLHPILLKQYYPYLDDDASGHFQVGRGYHRTKDGQKLLGYFEPWDQSKFDPTEPRIARSQWQSAYKSYRANQAHFQHNVGV
ncbi:hypothetical protein [Nocardioides sp.]|uniref:hypothetical protein n=1 Tax=Nocardioides sp. TaxID=35761 RepID=UPI00286E4985|nr:hypothetical protein [Nocardioides sp.]